MKIKARAVLNRRAFFRDLGIGNGKPNVLCAGTEQLRNSEQRPDSRINQLRASEAASFLQQERATAMMTS
jgi:hypothetical protein